MENHGYISLINWLIDASFKSHPRLVFPQFWINDFTRELFTPLLGDQLSGLVIMVMGLVIWTIYVWVEDTTTYKVATQSLLNVIQLFFFPLLGFDIAINFLLHILKGKSVLIYHLLTNCSHSLSTSKLYSVWFLGCGGGFVCGHDFLHWVRPHGHWMKTLISRGWMAHGETKLLSKVIIPTY